MALDGITVFAIAYAIKVVTPGSGFTGFIGQILAMVKTAPA